MIVEVNPKCVDMKSGKEKKNSVDEIIAQNLDEMEQEKDY
jgi:hypothetical protein